jgi:hypothetical protein
VAVVVPLLPHRPQRPRIRRDRAGQLGGPRTGLCVLLHTLRRRSSSTASVTTAPTSAGTVESSSSPSPSPSHSYPTPNNGGKGKDKGKRKRKGKNNGSGGSGNNSRGSNALVWPSLSSVVGASTVARIVPPPHKQQAIASTSLPWTGPWDQQSLANSFSTMAGGHRLSRRLLRLQPHHLRCW